MTKFPENNKILTENNIGITFLDTPVIDYNFNEFVIKAANYLNIIDGSIDIQFVSKDHIENMHKTYLKDDRVTDVISFNLGDKSVMMADIYICVYQAEKNAECYKVSLLNELKRLIVHGLLHCIGYNDQLEEDRKKMIALQEQILVQLNHDQ